MLCDGTECFISQRQCIFQKLKSFDYVTHFIWLMQCQECLSAEKYIAQSNKLTLTIIALERWYLPCLMVDMIFNILVLVCRDFGYICCAGRTLFSECCHLTGCTLVCLYPRLVFIFSQSLTGTVPSSHYHSLPSARPLSQRGSTVSHNLN